MSSDEKDAMACQSNEASVGGGFEGAENQGGQGRYQGSNPDMVPPYQHTNQAMEMTGQAGEQGSWAPPQGGQPNGFHQCEAAPMGPGHPGPQAGMLPGGPQGPNPMYGPAPMGPPHMPAGPEPGRNMHPGGYQPGWYQNPMMPPQGAPDMGHDQCGCHPGGSTDHHFKHEEYRHGQLMGVIQDFASGQPDVGRVMNLLQGCDTQFWKGALVGVTATLLLTNPTVKKAITDGVSGLWGVFQKEAPSKTSETAN